MNLGTAIALGVGIGLVPSLVHIALTEITWRRKHRAQRDAALAAFDAEFGEYLESAPLREAVSTHSERTA